MINNFSTSMLQCIFGDDVGRLIDMKMKVCEMPRVNRNTSTAHNNRSLFASFFFIWTFLSVWINFEECIKHLKTIYTLKLRPRSHNAGEIDKQCLHWENAFTFLVTLHRRNVKRHWTTTHHFGFVVYRKLITNNVFEKLRFQNVFRPH